jgi:hypothetical protein
MLALKVLFWVWSCGNGLSALPQQKSLPACVAKRLADSTTLYKRGIIALREVKIKGGYLYFFEQKYDRIAARRGLPTTKTYVDSSCNVVASLTVGGIVGIRVTTGFSAADFSPKYINRTLWKASVSRVH